MDEFSKRGVQYREYLKRGVANIVKKLDDIHNKFRFEESDFQK